MTPSSVTPTEVPESPSLTREAGAGPAFEMKFLLDEALARRAADWAREHLSPDPHGDPAIGGAYRTVSLYLDTPELDVFHRSPSYKRRKFRVRRYGPAPEAYLERKSKRGDKVSKRRSPVSDDDLARLGEPSTPEDWVGHWFHRRILARRLLPACRIAYERTAFAAATPDGPLRLTLDRQLVGEHAADWRVGPVVGVPLLPGRVVLELKFRAALPMAFKELLCDLGTEPASVSKYRLFRQVAGDV